MNKSKFLKRPLAALLAILMVVALVPMSAFAAEPDVIKVNGVEATLSGDAYSVSITAPNGTASVIENALKSVTFELRSKNGITVGILDKNDKQKDVDLSGWPDEPGTKQTINLLDYAVKPEGSYWGDYTGIKLQITSSAGDITTYPLTITVSERNASSDTTITAVESTRIVGANVDPVKHHIEIIKPVGSDNTAFMLGLKEENFKTASPYATVSFTKVSTFSIGNNNAADDKITKVTVTAEDKSTQEYTVSYKVEPIFTEFDVPDMVSYEEKEVDDGTTTTGNGVGKVEITVKVPFGTFPAAATEGKIIPTFTTSSNIKKIESNGTFTHGNGVLYERNRGTTSGVANWAANATANTAPGLNNGDTDLSFNFEVESGTSTLMTDSIGVGDITVKFEAVKNNKAELIGVNVSNEDSGNTGNGSYSQGLIDVTSTNRTIIVGDVADDNLKDVDDVQAGTDVVNATTRDIELHISKNAKVTVLNPNGLLEDDSKIYNDYSDGTDVGTLYTTTDPSLKASGAPADHDGIVILNDVNLRKYHSTPMRILVTSEDGANKTEYRLTFKGTPTGKPEIKSVTLHGVANGVDISSTQDKNGNIIIHVPYSEKPADNTVAKFVAEFTKISVKSTDGATVFDCAFDNTTQMKPVHIGSGTGGPAAIINEKSNIPGFVYDGTTAPASGVTLPQNCVIAMILDPSYASSSVEQTTAENPTYVYVYYDDAATTANITDITLTENNELVDAVGNKLPGKVNPNNKTIRLDVPYSFNRNDDNTTKAGTDLYLYDWAFNGVATANIVDGIAVAKRIDSNTIKYDFADLGKQTDSSAGNHVKHKAIIRLTEKEITSVADLGKFTPSRASDDKNVIRVWSEKTYSDANNKGTQEYIVYAVRQNANSESKLNNVTASAPVSVTKDTSVEKLNRFIITVPKNYNSTTGINDAKEFELDFSDRSKNSTVENGQTVWAAKDVDTVKFKVADGKLYFKDNEANLTDGRVIHFTIRAEDKTSTGAYEFLIREGEASKDATLKSVKVDENVSFTQDGDKFIVEDLSGNENYDVAKLPVVIETNDPGATVTVDGKDYKFDPATGTSNTTVDLSEGKTAEVVVTAADEVTTATYTLSMRDGSTPVEKPSEKYTDLDKVTNNTMRDKVKAAIDMGIMGSTSTTAYVFAPKANIGRKDIAVIIARADLIAGSEDIANAEQADEALKAMYTDGNSAFNDLARCKDVQKAAIRYCAEKEIVKGDGASFNPDGKLTREEIAVILTNWTKLDVDNNNVENTNNIADWNRISNWAKPYVNAVYGKMMNGTGTGFNPKGIVNREQTASVLVDAFGIIYPEFGN